MKVAAVYSKVIRGNNLVNVIYFLHNKDVVIIKMILYISMSAFKRRTIAPLLLLARLRRKGGRKRSLHWVHPLNQHRHQGDFHHLVAELRLDSQHHHQYFRMSAEQMDELLSFIGPELTRQSTYYRAAIEPKQTGCCTEVSFTFYRQYISDHKLWKKGLI